MAEVIMFKNNVLTMFTSPGKRNQLLFMLDGIIINIAYILTTGIVLSGYAIYLGAGDLLTALLNNCTNYATILSLFSFILFERSSNIKKLLLNLNLASRSLIFIIAFLPLIFHNNHIDLIFLTVLVIISEVIWSVYRIGWFVWMMNIIPKEIHSEYIYLRTFLIRLFMSLITLASGFILDSFNKGYLGFLILFTISYVFSILDVAILKRIKSGGPLTAGNLEINLKGFLQPLSSREYKNLLVLVFLFYLLLTMATSLTPIYLIRYLKLDYKFISIVNVVSLAAMVASNLYWGRVERKKGFRFVLCVTALFSAGEVLILSFLTSETWPLLFLSSTLAGIGAGGFSTSSFTYRYKIMPENGKTIFEGWFNFAFGLGMLIAPFAGNILIDVIPAFSAAFIVNSKMQLLYFISFSSLFLLIFFAFIKPIKKVN